MITNKQIIKERLEKIIQSKIENDVKISNLEKQARELKKRLKIDDEDSILSNQ